MTTFARIFAQMKQNKYLHRISKDLVQAMPLVQFEGEVVVVERMDEVSAAVAFLRRQRVLGVDTESRPSFKRGVHYPTALLQIASADRCYLFRLTHVGLPEEVAGLFSDPEIVKVGLAFKDDLRGLQRRRQFKPQNCIDLQHIVASYGIFDLGLQKMYAICYGGKISKSQQLTNWENSHLTESQARYASTDAWATLMIYNDLMQTEKLPDTEVMRLKAEDAEQQQMLNMQKHENKYAE